MTEVQERILELSDAKHSIAYIVKNLKESDWKNKAGRFYSAQGVKQNLAFGLRKRAARESNKPKISVTAPDETASVTAPPAPPVATSGYLTTSPYGQVFPKHATLPPNGPIDNAPARIPHAGSRGLYATYAVLKL